MKCKKLLSLVLSAVVLTNTFGEPIFSFAAAPSSVEESEATEDEVSSEHNEQSVHEDESIGENTTSEVTPPIPEEGPVLPLEEELKDVPLNISDAVRELEKKEDLLKEIFEMKEEKKAELFKNLTKEDGYFLKSLYQYGLVNKMVEYNEKKEVTSEDRMAFHSYIDTFNQIKSEKKDFIKEDINRLEEEVLNSLTKDLDKEAKEKINDHETYMEYLQTTTKLDVTNAYKEFGDLWDSVPEEAEAVTKEVKSFIDATFGFDEQEESETNTEKTEKEDLPSQEDTQDKESAEKDTGKGDVAEEKAPEKGEKPELEEKDETDNKSESKKKSKKDKKNDTDSKENSTNSFDPTKIKEPENSSYPFNPEYEIITINDPADKTDKGLSTCAFSQDGTLGISGSRYDKFRVDGVNPNMGCGIKWIMGDGDHPDAAGKWRNVYCLQYSKDSPNGIRYNWSNSWTNKKVEYAVYYGAMYYGETCRYAPYSTGYWDMDYFVTQMAVHILNGEYSLSSCSNSINRSKASASEKSLAIDRITKIVNDANSAGNYTSFDSAGWFDKATNSLSLSGYSNSWSASGSNYYTGGWVTPTFTSYYGYDDRMQINGYSISAPSGVTVERNGNSIYAPFRLRCSAAQYKEWQKTGKTLNVTVTAKVPQKWGVAIYTPQFSNYQNIGIFMPESSSVTYSFSKTVTFTIPKTIYNDGIGHWAGGFKNGEGNNGNKSMFKLADTNFEGTVNQNFVMDASRKTKVPNGFSLSNTFGTSAISGSWAGYSMGTSVKQKAQDMWFEYDYMPNTYNITYNLNGGTNISSNPSTYNVLYGVKFSNPTRAGYTFLGWYNTATGKKITGINEGSNASFSSATDLYNKLASRTTGNITVEARWQPIGYTVKFNGNGSSGGSMEDQIIMLDESKALIPNEFTKTGYLFKNWNTQPNGEGITYTDQQVVKNLANAGGTVNLYAQWTPITYTIKYDGNGATSGSTENSSHTYDKEKELTPNGYSKTGYIFTGWNTKPDGQGKDYADKESVMNLTTTDGEVINLYAKWTPITYTIKYDGNEATGGSTADSSHTYDKAKELTPNGYSKTGYIFSGWTLNKDGSGTIFTDKQVVKNLTANDGAVVTIYAKWSPITYTIEYNGNGATGGVTPSVTHTYDKSAEIQKNGFIRENFGFVEWNTKPDGTGTKYTPGQQVVNLSSKQGDKIILYAIWTEQIVVVYDGNGATSGTPKNEVIEADDVEKAGTYTVKKNTGYTGYKKTENTYMGWYEDRWYQSIPRSKYFLESNTTKLTWQQMKDIMARQQAERIATQPKMAFFAVGFANIPEAVADTGQKMTMYAAWDKKPDITVGKAEDSQRIFYEGTTVKVQDLLKGVTVTDTEDEREGLTEDLLKSLKVIKIEYAPGKLVGGVEQSSYVKEFPDGMPADATLDTWFMQMRENAEVHHKVTYQATDSAGNVTTAVGDVIVMYNQFPTLKAQERWFTLKEAQAGVITEKELLDDQITQGDTYGKDAEEGNILTPGTDPLQISMLDFDAEEFTHFNNTGTRVITLHTQDTFGPGGKGKETVRQFKVHVVKDGEIPDENAGKEVRFISKKYYDLNKDVDTTGMTEEEIEALNHNGGLRVDSVWYKDPEYRALIEATFEKTKGDAYKYTLEEVEQIKEFVEIHGIGNSKEPDALKKFEEQFGQCTYE